MGGVDEGRAFPPHQEGVVGGAVAQPEFDVKAAAVPVERADRAGVGSDPLALQAEPGRAGGPDVACLAALGHGCRSHRYPRNGPELYGDPPWGCLAWGLVDAAAPAQGARAGSTSPVLPPLPDRLARQLSQPLDSLHPQQKSPGPKAGARSRSGVCLVLAHWGWAGPGGRSLGGPSAFHGHRHAGGGLGLGGGDGEQAIAVVGFEALAVDASREAEAAAPGAVGQFAQQRGRRVIALV